MDRGEIKPTKSKDGYGWDDFDPFADSSRGDSTTAAKNYPKRSGSDRRMTMESKRDPLSTRPRRSSSSEERNYKNNPRRNNDDGDVEWTKRSPRQGPRGQVLLSENGNRQRKPIEYKRPANRQINMNALEGAGFVHLYGLSSVLNALAADKREFVAADDSSPLGMIDQDNNQEYEDDDDDDNDKSQGGQNEGGNRIERKPEAQFRPWLFVQDMDGKGGRRGTKALAAEQVLQLAEKRGVPVAEVDKGILNTLSGNRPHQVSVLVGKK